MAPPPAKKPTVKKVIPKAKAFVTPKKSLSPPKGRSQVTKPVQGNTINIDGFGGEVTTTAGSTVTLKELLDQSEAGVVLFTYPKAKTGGCQYLLVFCPFNLT